MIGKETLHLYPKVPKLEAPLTIKGIRVSADRLDHFWFHRNFTRSSVTFLYFHLHHTSFFLFFNTFFKKIVKCVENIFCKLSLTKKFTHALHNYSTHGNVEKPIGFTHEFHRPTSARISLMSALKNAGKCL